MSNIDNLARHVARLQASLPLPQADYMQSSEWNTLHLVMQQTLTPYPDANSAVASALLSIEKPASQASVHDVLAHTLKPFLDARIALAEALSIL